MEPCARTGQLILDTKGQCWALCPLGRQQHSQAADGQQWPRGAEPQAPAFPSRGSPAGPGRDLALQPWREVEGRSRTRHAGSITLPRSRPKCPPVPSGLGAFQVLHMAGLPENLYWVSTGPWIWRQGARATTSDVGTEQYHTAALGFSFQWATRALPLSFSRMQGGWAGRTLGSLPIPGENRWGGPMHLQGLRTASAWPTEGAPAHHHLSAGLPGPPRAGAATSKSPRRAPDVCRPENTSQPCTARVPLRSWGGHRLGLGRASPGVAAGQTGAAHNSRGTWGLRMEELARGVTKNAEGQELIHRRMGEAAQTPLCPSQQDPPPLCGWTASKQKERESLPSPCSHLAGVCLPGVDRETAVPLGHSDIQPRCPRPS